MECKVRSVKVKSVKCKVQIVAWKVASGKCKL